jgi:hypothetical protein
MDRMMNTNFSMLGSQFPNKIILSFNHPVKNPNYETEIRI